MVPVQGQGSTWAVFILAGEWPEATIREARRQLFLPTTGNPEDEHPFDWEVTVGTGRWAAVRGDDPSGEDALLIAPLISRAVPGKVYAAIIPEYLRGSYVWEAGRSLGEVAKSPEALADELGVPFPKLGGLP